MKATLLFLLLLIGAAGAVAQAQTPIDTTGGRYYQPIFPNVTVTPGVVYGSAITFSGATQQLLMDIYQPTGDVAAERPVIIFAHQGGFVGGSRNEQYMEHVPEDVRAEIDDLEQQIISGEITVESVMQ